jgi:hypothetical protein
MNYWKNATKRRGRNAKNKLRRRVKRLGASQAQLSASRLGVVRQDCETGDSKQRSGEGTSSNIAADARGPGVEVYFGLSVAGAAPGEIWGRRKRDAKGAVLPS